jgi:hypothetical protein
MELQAEWELDCHGKQDYDADLVRLSTRYWPRGNGYAEMTADGRWLENATRPSIPPSATATIYLQDEPLTTASFEGATEAEVKVKVESWAREQFAKVATAMGAAFRA